MKSKLAQSGFSRRVVGYYLFFCMIAVTWLSLGVLTTTQGVLSSRATSSCLARLGQLAAAIEMDLLRNEGAEIQQLIDRAKMDGRLAYCSIVGVDGRYLAHTTKPLSGAPAVEPSGSHLSWGSVDGVRYKHDLHGMVSEYRVPLSVNGAKHGTLRLAVDEPNFHSVLSDVADEAPLAIILPLVCVVFGATLIRRMVKPFATIEEQLLAVAGTPYGQTFTPKSVSSGGLAAAGWNRLVELVAKLGSDSPQSGLTQRVSDALAKRKQDQSLAVLQALGEGIAVTDAEGRIEFANAAVESLLNSDGAEDFDSAPLTAALVRLGDGAERIIEAGPSSPVVAELDAGDEARPRVIRVERQPLEGERGRAVWSLRDVTQQKLAEKSRDQFIDAATHELRTPLANIKAYAETLALSELDDPEQHKEFCNTINTEATRLSRFVDDLLDISSMEVGSLTIRRQNVDMERLLREASEKVRPLIEKKSQSLEVVLPPKLGEMHLDKDKISALMVNLLGNASKYTPEEGSVRFKAEPAEDALIVTVTDTGVGISEEEQPRVFEKFFRSEDPQVRGEAGTGLGLSLAREIARLHGGDVTVHSVVGEGSTFTVTLPRSRRDTV